MKFFIAIALVGFLAACSDAPTTTRVLASQGYTNITTTGHSFFSCSKNDSYSTGFVATAPNGQRVKGAVCSGFFTGSVVRTF